MNAMKAMDRYGSWLDAGMAQSPWQAAARLFGSVTLFIATGATVVAVIGQLVA